MPRLNSVLYLPASNVRALEKARTIPADAIVFDLEDSVAPQAKAQAREQLISALKQGDYGGSVTVVRTNQIDSPDYLKDLDTIVKCRPQVVLLPKVSTATHVATFEQDALARGLKEGTGVWYMIETAGGLVNLENIIQTGVNSRYEPECLVVGHNDLAVETGVTVTPGREYLIPWLMQLVLHAKHNRLTVLDSVYNNHKDLAGFEAQTLQAKAMGFSGKSLIHPAQVDICNRVFSPTAAEIEHARAVVAAFASAENSGAGVISLNGEMIERMHLEQAKQVLS